MGVAVGDGLLEADAVALGEAVGPSVPSAHAARAVVRSAAKTTAERVRVRMRLIIGSESLVVPPTPSIGRGAHGRGYRDRVTRIIAGRAGSITLDVPDAGTRPTSDRVRESLFGALESADALRGAAVLDLYAGSGALGLEAVSRGAATVDLVEKSPRAAAVAERNGRRVAKSVGPDAAIRVHRASVSTFLSTTRGPYDLVFLDPPYDLGDAELSEALELLVRSLSGDAVVVIERAARTPRPILPVGLVHDREKKYGDTVLWWARPGG